MLLKNRVFTRFRPLTFVLAALMVASSICVCDLSADARSRSSKSKSKVSSTSRASSSTKSRGASRSRGSARASRSRTRTIVQFSGSKRRSVTVARGRSSRSSRRSRTIRIVRQPRPKYAYPLSLFLMHAPSFEKSPLDQRMSERIARAWDRGVADNYPARTLVRAGVVAYHPLRGGIYYRREPVKYIILHSTETGVPVRAVNVIEGWSSMGRRHPGAQYVVERDGTIYQAVDPDLATVHVNIFKTLPGINNDNSIGIEMNHTGRQNYPEAQREAVSKLLAYLQQRYQVEHANVVTHRYAQQGDHTDPVNFDLDGFLAYKNQFQKQAIAYKVKGLEQEVKTWNAPDPTASTMLQPHPSQNVDVIERVEKIEKTEKVKVAPLPSTEETAGNLHRVNGLELKGPIEVDPAAASDLNQKETFEVDGPGATKGGEASEAAKTEPAKSESEKPKFTPVPDAVQDGKLMSPAPAHSKFAPAHVINQVPHKEVNQVIHKDANPSVRANESPLTQFVPGDKVSRPHAAPALHSIAPKALAQRIPVAEAKPVEAKPIEAKPAARKSVFQRMRTYLKENFQ